MDFKNDAGNTPFAIYRSLFWDQAKKNHQAKGPSESTEMGERKRVLGLILSDYNVMNFIVQLSLLYFDLGNSVDETVKNMNDRLLNFSYELANY